MPNDGPHFTIQLGDIDRAARSAGIEVPDLTRRPGGAPQIDAEELDPNGHQPPLHGFWRHQKRHAQHGACIEALRRANRPGANRAIIKHYFFWMHNYAELRARYIEDEMMDCAYQADDWVTAISLYLQEAGIEVTIRERPAPERPARERRPYHRHHRAKPKPNGHDHDTSFRSQGNGADLT